MSLLPCEYSTGPERCLHGIDAAVECLGCEDDDRELDRQRAFACVRNQAEACHGKRYHDAELELLRDDLCEFGLEAAWDRHSEALCALYLELRLAVGAAPDFQVAT